HDMVRFLHGGGVLSKDCFWRIDSNEPAATAASSLQLSLGHPRMKIPSGQGMWPAFWMLGDDIEALGWPKCGEIDVMENIGKEPAIVHGTVHGPQYFGKGGITSQHFLPAGKALSDDFHVYAVLWSPSSIKFLLDGTVYTTVTPASLPKGAKWVFDHPFFLLLNLAVGGDWPGAPDATSSFPEAMQVDWVRISQPVE
ncbi:MAG: glycoside hydrolase family 16 protein, partial [Bryobacteraceae bacterium]